MRGYSLFLTACMALIAASIAAVLHVVLDFPVGEAAFIGLACLFAMVALEVAAARRRDRGDFDARLEDLARAVADVAREVGEVRHRVVALERQPAPDPKAGQEPLSREIAELAGVIETVAQSAAALEARMAEVEERALRPAEELGFPPIAALKPPVPSNPQPPGPLAGKTDEEIRRMVRDALEANRFEVYLQPVVTLPQRKVRFYEALSRLRMGDDQVIEAARFIPAARAAGLLPKIDERLVHGAVQIVRRAAAKGREIGLFLNIAPETLADRASFTELLGYLESNRALASSLVLELPQSAYRSLGPVELSGMAQLAERGFRFSLDRIEDFRLDPRGLAERGVRFIKAPADLMLNQHAVAGHIHPADLADLLGRYGIDLVAERIESESIVIDLLEIDVRFGQGYLFSQPRPVRAETAGDRPAMVAEPQLPLAAPEPVARPA